MDKQQNIEARTGDAERPQESCVDGPFGFKSGSEILTSGSIALMCPALLTRHHDRWPRWVPRSSPKQARGPEEGRDS